MLIRPTSDVYRHQITKAVGKDATGDQVLDYLFGTYDEMPDADFVIRKWTGDDKTIINRLNMFWAIPLTMLLSPIQYLLKGQVGWDTKTKAGRFILRVTGHLKSD